MAPPDPTGAPTAAAAGDEHTSPPTAAAATLSRHTAAGGRCARDPASQCSCQVTMSGVSRTVAGGGARRVTWTARTAALLLTWLLVSDCVARACVPGRGFYRRRAARKLTPLVFKEYVPNVGEKTLGASGLPEGAIAPHDERFQKLVPSYSEDIVFKDDEGTGEDRVMSKRVQAKLSTLAISVMNQWPGVRLRVIEGYDTSRLHAPQSLHYEGRAVDVTTSDRDRSKYGTLARLAVEAGFDWVFYESRFHIHCSVKSDLVAGRSYGGCFSGDTEATLADGRRRRFDQLRRGDVVKAVDETGAVVDSEVLLWLDRDPAERRLFHRLTTASGRQLTLTPGHLVYVLGAERVTHVTVSQRTGVFAPLTQHGTVVASGVVASCYAQVDSQRLAHWALAPARWAVNARQAVAHAWHNVVGGAEQARQQPPPPGVHWYVRLLYSLSKVLLPHDMMLD